MGVAVHVRFSPCLVADYRAARVTNGLMLEALDDLRPNEVYVATGGSFRYAFWGELMSTRARYLRAAGAVLNGFVRDADGIEALKAYHYEWDEERKVFSNNPVHDWSSHGCDGFRGVGLVARKSAADTYVEKPEEKPEKPTKPLTKKEQEAADKAAAENGGGN